MYLDHGVRDGCARKGIPTTTAICTRRSTDEEVYEAGEIGCCRSDVDEGEQTST